MIVDLDFIKAHGRYSGSDEDSMLLALAEAAEDACMRYMNTTADALFEEFGQIPMGIRIAVCMLTNEMYQHREATSSQALQSNPAFATLLNQYKKLVV